MFDELIDTISLAFTVAFIVVVIVFIAGIVKGIEQSQARAEMEKKKQEDKQKLMERIARETPKTPTKILIVQRDELLEAYRELYDCKQRNSMKKKEIIPIFRVGDLVQPISVDLETCQDILKIFNDEIQRRQG